MYNSYWQEGVKVLSYAGVISWDTTDQLLYGGVELWNWVFDVLKKTSLMCNDIEIDTGKDGKFLIENFLSNLYT